MGHLELFAQRTFAEETERITESAAGWQDPPEIRLEKVQADGILVVRRPHGLEHQGVVVSAVFSPDGTRIVTASGDKTARVWDAATGTPITRPLEHQDLVWSAALSPDGTRVVTASWDKTARVWDAATGTPIASPLEHQYRVMSAAFSPDGTRVVTASGDKTARVWDAATGKPITRPFEHQDKVASAAFSPDGTRVVTASLDKTAQVWDVRLDEGTLEQWSAIAERSPFVLDGIDLVRRAPRPASKPAD